MADTAWNPPPPEDEEKRSPDVDAIGDTVFSKAWALSMLVKAVALVDKKDDDEADGEGADGDQKSDLSAPPAKKPAHDYIDRRLELDEETDNDLCRLWDATVNQVRLLVDKNQTALLHIIIELHVPKSFVSFSCSR